MNQARSGDDFQSNNLDNQLQSTNTRGVYVCYTVQYKGAVAAEVYTYVREVGPQLHHTEDFRCKTTTVSWRS
jgi:hypothetical protein